MRWPRLTGQLNGTGAGTSASGRRRRKLLGRHKGDGRFGGREYQASTCVRNGHIGRRKRRRWKEVQRILQHTGSRPFGVPGEISAIFSLAFSSARNMCANI